MSRNKLDCRTGIYPHTLIHSMSMTTTTTAAAAYMQAKVLMHVCCSSRITAVVVTSKGSSMISSLSLPDQQGEGNKTYHKGEKDVCLHYIRFSLYQAGLVCITIFPMHSTHVVLLLPLPYDDLSPLLYYAISTFFIIHDVILNAFIRVASFVGSTT